MSTEPVDRVYEDYSAELAARIAHQAEALIRLHRSGLALVAQTGHDEAVRRTFLALRDQFYRDIDDMVQECEAARTVADLWLVDRLTEAKRRVQLYLDKR